MKALVEVVGSAGVTYQQVFEGVMNYNTDGGSLDLYLTSGKKIATFAELYWVSVRLVDDQESPQDA